MSERNERMLMVHFNVPVFLGLAAVPVSHLQIGGKDAGIGNKTVRVFYDKDPRFLRIEVVEEESAQLVPLSNVNSIGVLYEKPGKSGGAEGTRTQAAGGQR